MIAYDNGVAELRANGTTLTSRNIDLVNYPFGNSTLSLGHFPGLNSDNGYEGHIDRVEVEIFD